MPLLHSSLALLGAAVLAGSGLVTTAPVPTAFVTPAMAAGALTSALATIKGEIVDLECSTAKGAAGSGERHAACAMTCAKDGGPMALLTEQAVYVIEGSYVADRNAKLLDFVARKVEAKGTLTERDGRAYINIAAMVVQK